MEATIQKHKKKVYIYYSHAKKIFRESTGIDWDKKTDGDNQRLITAQLKRVNDIITAYKLINPESPTVEYIKQQLAKPTLVKSKVVLELLDNTINLKSKDKKPGTIKDWTNLRTAVVRYEVIHGTLSVGDIDETFYHNFQDFLSQPYTVETKRGRKLRRDGLNSNTIRKRFNTFNIMLKLNGIEKPNFKPIKGYTPEFEFLTREEVREILDLNLSGMKEKIRDIFVILCLTGMRYSDYTTLMPHHIKNGAIEKESVKTHDKFLVPIHEEVHKIFTKYGFTAENGWQGVLPVYQVQVIDREIKKVVEGLPSFQNEVIRTVKSKNREVQTRHKRHELIGSHTGRRSFIYQHITNEVNGIPSPTPIVQLSEMTGHKTLNILMGYYQRFKKPHYIFVDNIKI